ncbi:MaoC family dehydratase [Pseudorhodoferax sp. Leaf265]|jgi:acyl dehydratase|uniref:MaoC family dehydratase n=1 Tax=Pseudorhodoferax sp. Leaf265 TaxID=1736315 RepID=UPI000701BE31|nr:MaoC family dehydratase [Pseudorhodoferax sp. Leaf265]KQP17252.1 dehydratase [Pseudorhodoferax sp. Leaf265]PZQ00958.1 MAG: dehydratase [Variovorax paradoxus]PZQ13840.1 MAG: dehydratase [Variovorax paradoxus]
MTISYDQIRVGDALPAFETEPISRLTLALYCGASGDHNPIHVDTDFAKAAGVGDVFAHGMLSMAYLGRLLTNWVPQSALREYGVRFVAITQVGAKVRCEGRVTEKFEQDGERRVRVELSTTDQNGQTKLSGDAVVALS